MRLLPHPATPTADRSSVTLTHLAPSGANLSTATGATIAPLPSVGGAAATVRPGPELQLSESAAQLVVPADIAAGDYVLGEIFMSS